MFSIRHNAAHENGSKYYICARRDNGFIPAYRAYFFINGNKIKRVSVFRYEHCVIFGKRADEYKFFFLPIMYLISKLKTMTRQNGRSGRMNMTKRNMI